MPYRSGALSIGQPAQPERIDCRLQRGAQEFHELDLIGVPNLGVKMDEVHLRFLARRDQPQLPCALASPRARLDRNLIEVELGFASMHASIADEVACTILFRA